MVRLPISPGGRARRLGPLQASSGSTLGPGSPKETLEPTSLKEERPPGLIASLAARRVALMSSTSTSETVSTGSPASPTSPWGPQPKSGRPRPKLESEVKSASALAKEDRSSCWVRLEQEVHGMRNLRFLRQKAAVNVLVSRLSMGGGKLTSDQIKEIYGKFRNCDKDGSAYVYYDEFLQGLDLEDSNGSRRIFQACDMDGNGAVNYDEFIELLASYAHIGATALGCKPSERLGAIIAQVEKEIADAKGECGLGSS